MSCTILAVSGSLRTSSINTEVLLAMAALAGDDVNVVQYDKLASLPHFNPDHDTDPPPASVAEWRAALHGADAVLISTPEYAHGVPGALKNALDWVVGSGEFMYKPVAIVVASQGSAFVGPQLVETLHTMMAVMAPAATVTLPILGRKRDAMSMQLDDEISAVMRQTINELAFAVAEARTETSS